MHTPNTPQEDVKRVLHAYDHHRAVGFDHGAAIEIAAAQLRAPRETIIKALAVRAEATPQLRLVA